MSSLKDLIKGKQPPAAILSAARAKYPELSSLDDEDLQGALISADPEFESAFALTPAGVKPGASKAPAPLNPVQPTTTQQDPVDATNVFKNIRAQYNIPPEIPDNLIEDLTDEKTGMPLIQPTAEPAFKVGDPRQPTLTERSLDVISKRDRFNSVLKPAPEDTLSAPDPGKTGFADSFKSGNLKLAGSTARIPDLGLKASTFLPNLAWKTISPESPGPAVIDIATDQFSAKNKVAGYLEKAAESASFVKRKWTDRGENFKTILERGDKVELANYLAHQVIENAPNQLALVAATLAGAGPAALAGMGLTTAAQTWAETAKTSSASSDRRFLNAVVNGSIEAGMERLGTFGLLKHWEMPLARAFGSGEAKKIIANVGKAVVSSVAGEASEEVATEFGQSLSSYMFGVDPNAMTGIGMKMLEAGAIGGLSGGTITAGGAVIAGTKTALDARSQREATAEAGLSESLGTQNLPPFSSLTTVAPAIQNYVKTAFPELIPALGTTELPIRPDQLEAEIMKASIAVSDNVKAGADPQTAKQAAIESMIDSIHGKTVGAPVEGLQIVDAPVDPMDAPQEPTIEDPFTDPGYMAALAQQEAEAQVTPEIQPLPAQPAPQTPPAASKAVIVPEALRAIVAKPKQKPVKYDRSGIPIRKPDAVVATVDIGGEAPIKILHKSAISESKVLRNMALEDYEQRKNESMLGKISGKIRWTKALEDLGDFKGLPLWVRGQFFTKDQTAKELDEHAMDLGVPDTELIAEIVDYARNYKKKPSAKLGDYYDLAISSLERAYMDPGTFGDPENPSSFSASENIRNQYRAESLFSDPKENPTQRYERLIKQARSQGMDQGAAQKWARSQMQASPDAARTEPKPKQAEFGDAGGVQSFGRGEKGQNELFEPLAPYGVNEAEQRAVQFFGTTDNIENAGYVLSSGKMLDITGGPREKPTDHREIATFILGMNAKDLSTDSTGWLNKQGFMKASGALRVVTDKNTLAVQSVNPPSLDQLRSLVDAIIEKNPKRITMEIIGKGGESLRFKEVDNPTPEDITRFYYGTSQVAEKRSNYDGREESQDVFFSAVQKTIDEKMPAKASAQQVLGMLKNTPGIKQEEIDWLGLPQFLEGKQSVTKEELKKFVAENNVQVQEVTKGEGDWAVYDGESNQYFGTQSEAIAYAKEMGINITEDTVFRGTNRDDNHTKFDRYTLPGGENYRELLLTLPSSQPEVRYTKENLKLNEDESRTYNFGIFWIIEGPGQTFQIPKSKFQNASDAINYVIREKQPGPRLTNKDFSSSHFNEPNILAHIRFNDRTDLEGKRILFIEEVQSDWHQQGREKGYKNKDLQNEINALIEEHMANYRIAHGPAITPEAEAAKLAALKREMEISERVSRLDNMRFRAVPDAPFKKTWHELALKRMLRYAAENGYDKIAWTTGEQQAERYDLSKHISRISYGTQTHKLNAYDTEGRNVISKEASPAELPDYIGKEAAQKLLAQDDLIIDGWPNKVLKDADLKVGGEGMKGFYDQIIPSFLNKYTKKWGGRVSETTISKTGGIGQWRYEGPSLTAEQILDLRQTSPLADAMTATVLRQIADGVKRGLTTARAVEDFGSYHAARAMGGELVDIALPLPVHSLDIIPSMKESVMQGQALFEKKSPAQWQNVPPASEAKQLSLDLNVDPSTAPAETKIAPLKTPLPAEKGKVTLSNGLAVDIFDSPFSVEFREKGSLVFPNKKVTSPADVAFAFRFLTTEQRENIFIGAMKNGRVIGVEHIGIGTIDQVAAYPREIVSLLSKMGADSFFMVHNHPSGYVDPSNEDLRLTTAMKKLAEEFNVKLWGHVIIDDTKFGFIDPDNNTAKYEHTAYAKTKAIPILEKYFEWKAGAGKSIIQNRPMFTSPASVFNFFKGLQRTADDTLVTYLNVQNNIIKSMVIPKGSLNAKEVIVNAAAFRASAIVTANTGLSNVSISEIKTKLRLSDIRYLDEITPTDGGQKFTSAASSASGFEARGEYSVAEEPAPFTIKDPGSNDKESIYDRARNFKGPGVADTTRDFINDRKGVIRKTTDKIFGTFTTRLSNIAPRLKIAIRQFELDYRQAIKADLDRVRNVLDGLDRVAKESPADMRVLDLALKNGAVNLYTDIGRQYGIDFSSFHAWSDQIRRRIKSAGFEVGYLPGYFPRMIRDKKGFTKFMEQQSAFKGEIERAIQEKERSLGGGPLTEEQRINLINSFIRGFARSKIALAHTGNMKTREIEGLTPHAAQFYYGSREALVRYIVQVNEAIEARKFFGRTEAKPDLDDDAEEVLARMSDEEKRQSALSFNNINQSIGAFVNRMLERGEITPRQQTELRELFEVRFGYSGGPAWMGVYKNIAYMDTITSFISTLTQLEDLGVAMYRAAWQTPGSFLRAIANRSNIKIEDLGLEAMNEEIREMTGSASLLRKFLFSTGFTFMDRVGKETYINAVIDKYRAQIQKGNIDPENRITDIFGAKADEVIEDLKSGRTTENVLFLAFNEISDAQPISLSEVPELYLESPGMRLFYALKTFMVRRLDFIRQETMRGGGNPKDKLIRFLKLYAVLVVFGAGVDEIKDFILGRKTRWQDRVIDNLLKPFGVSKWLLYKIRSDGLGQAAFEYSLPPMKFVHSIWKDVNHAGDPIVFPDGHTEPRMLEITASIPIGGKLWYWWFGRGRQKERFKQQLRKQRLRKGWTEREIEEGKRDPDRKRTARGMGSF